MNYDSKQWEWGRGVCNKHRGHEIPCKACIETNDPELFRPDVMRNAEQALRAGFGYTIEHPMPAETIMLAKIMADMTGGPRKTAECRIHPADRLKSMTETIPLPGIDSCPLLPDQSIPKDAIGLRITTTDHASGRVTEEGHVLKPTVQNDEPVFPIKFAGPMPHQLAPIDPTRFDVERLQFSMDAYTNETPHDPCNLSKREFECLGQWTKRRMHPDIPKDEWNADLFTMAKHAAMVNKPAPLLSEKETDAFGEWASRAVAALPKGNPCGEMDLPLLLPHQVDLIARSKSVYFSEPNLGKTLPSIELMKKHGVVLASDVREMGGSQEEAEAVQKYQRIMATGKIPKPKDFSPSDWAHILDRAERQIGTDWANRVMNEVQRVEFTIKDKLSNPCGEVFSPGRYATTLSDTSGTMEKAKCSYLLGENTAYTFDRESDATAYDEWVQKKISEGKLFGCEDPLPDCERVQEWMASVNQEQNLKAKFLKTMMLTDHERKQIAWWIGKRAVALSQMGQGTNDTVHIHLCQIINAPTYDARSKQVKAMMNGGADYSAPIVEYIGNSTFNLIRNGHIVKAAKDMKWNSVRCRVLNAINNEIPDIERAVLEPHQPVTRVQLLRILESTDPLEAFKKMFK